MKHKITMGVFSLGVIFLIANGLRRDYEWNIDTGEARSFISCYKIIMWRNSYPNSATKNMAELIGIIDNGVWAGGTWETLYGECVVCTPRGNYLTLHHISRYYHGLGDLQRIEFINEIKGCYDINETHHWRRDDLNVVLLKYRQLAEMQNDRYNKK